MQTQCLLNLSDKAIVDKARLIGGTHNLAFAMRAARIFRFAFPILLMIPFSVIATETPAIDPANMDLRAKPGDDFYQFANGGWLERNPIPPEYSR